MSMEKNLSGRSRWRRWLLRIGILLGLIAVITTIVMLRPRRVFAVRAAQVKIDVVRDVVTSVEAGDIKPHRQAMVRIQLSNPVLVVHFQVGDRVKEGAIVVQLDERDQKAQLFQAGSGVNGSAAQRAQALARIETLSKEAKRNKALEEQGAAPKQIVDTSERALEEAKTSVGVVAAQVKQSFAARRVAELMLEKTRIRAPFDGVITQLPIHEGDVLPLGSPALEIIDDHRMYLQVAVDEADSAKVRLGQEAILRLDALPKERVLGKISRIDPSVKRDIKGARTLLLDIEILDLPSVVKRGLLAGMSANAEIVVAQKERAWTVPTGAILGRGVKTEVYALQPAGKDKYTLKKIPVRVGVSNWERTEIMPDFATEQGLALGSWVLSSLNEKELTEGALVKRIPETGN